MDGRAVDSGHRSGDADRPDHLIGGHGPHTDHQFAVEDTGLLTVDVGQIHGHVFSFLNVPHRHSGGQKLALEGEGAADEEVDEILPPEPGNVRVFSGQLAVFPDPVLGDVGSDVRAVCHFLDQAAAHVAHLQNGAGFGISLGEQQKIIGLLSGQDQQISLGVTGAHAGGLSRDLPLPDQRPHFGWLHGGVIHMVSLFQIDWSMVYS